MLPVSQAEQMILDLVQPLRETESIDLTACDGADFGNGDRQSARLSALG